KPHPLASLAPIPPPLITEATPIDKARTAFNDADVDRAFELANGLLPSFERSALLVRCARDIGTLAAARTALDAVDALDEKDRQRLNHNKNLARIVESLSQLSAA